MSDTFDLRQAEARGFERGVTAMDKIWAILYERSRESVSSRLNRIRCEVRRARKTRKASSTSRETKPASPCRCCRNADGVSGLHTCYDKHDCAHEPCEWCGHRLGAHEPPKKA